MSAIASHGVTVEVDRVGADQDSDYQHPPMVPRRETEAVEVKFGLERAIFIRLTLPFLKDNPELCRHGYSYICIDLYSVTAYSTSPLLLGLRPSSTFSVHPVTLPALSDYRPTLNLKYYSAIYISGSAVLHRSTPGPPYLHRNVLSRRQPRNVADVEALNTSNRTKQQSPQPAIITSDYDPIACGMSGQVTVDINDYIGNGDVKVAGVNKGHAKEKLLG